MKIEMSPTLTASEIETMRDYFNTFFHTDFQVTIKSKGIIFEEN